MSRPSKKSLKRTAQSNDHLVRGMGFGALAGLVGGGLIGLLAGAVGLWAGMGLAVGFAAGLAVAATRASAHKGR